MIQLNLLRDASEKKGIHIYEVAFDEKEDPISQIEKFSGHVDAVYIPADETVLKSFDEIVKHLMKLGIPVIGVISFVIPILKISLIPDTGHQAEKSRMVLGMLGAGIVLWERHREQNRVII